MGLIIMETLRVVVDTRVGYIAVRLLLKLFRCIYFAVSIL